MKTAAAKQPEETQLVNPAVIRTDGGTQSRCKLDLEAVQDLAEALRAGNPIPAIRVYDDGTDLWLADGFHRVAAAKVVELDEIEALVLPGGQRDAFLYCLGANSEHGVRRTSADKRRAVHMALDDEELSQKSDREIARVCAVSHTMVSNLRRERETAATAASAPAPTSTETAKPTKAPEESDAELVVMAIEGMEALKRAKPGHRFAEADVRKEFCWLLKVDAVTDERWQAAKGEAFDQELTDAHGLGAERVMWRVVAPPTQDAPEQPQDDGDELCDTALLCQILLGKKGATPAAVARHSWCGERDMAPASTKAQERWQRTLDEGARDGLWTYDAYGNLVLTEKGGAAPVVPLDLEEAAVALERRLQARGAAPGRPAQMGTVRPELSHVLDRGLTDEEWREIVEYGERMGRWCHLGELAGPRLLGPIWIPAEPKDPTDVEDLEEDPDTDADGDGSEDELEEEADEDSEAPFGQSFTPTPAPAPPRAAKPTPSAMPPEHLPQPTRVPVLVTGVLWGKPARNLQRLEALGKLAVVKGYAPILPALMLWQDVYGRAGLGRDDTPDSTIETALSCSTALAAAVGQLGGGLWELLPDDPSESVPELEAEGKAFSAAHPGPSRPHSLSMTWRSWKVHFEAAGLLALWSQP
jgi:hypothetical protein